MANRKKQVYKPKPMTEGKRNLIQGLLQEYDIQEALKDLLSGTIQDMLETEMDSHLGIGVLKVIKRSDLLEFMIFRSPKDGKNGTD